MNDWWNDPPLDEPEPPECPHDNCDGVGGLVTLYSADGESGECWQCEYCGRRWPYDEPQEPDLPDQGEEEDTWCEPPPAPSTCPHGRPWGECSACDHAGDLAYDAAREAQGRR